MHHKIQESEEASSEAQPGESRQYMGICQGINLGKVLYQIGFAHEFPSSDIRDLSVTKGRRHKGRNPLGASASAMPTPTFTVSESSPLRPCREGGNKRKLHNNETQRQQLGKRTCSLILKHTCSNSVLGGENWPPASTTGGMIVSFRPVAQSTQPS